MQLFLLWAFYQVFYLLILILKVENINNSFMFKLNNNIIYEIECVLKNKTCPTHLLNILKSVLINDNCPVHLLEKFSHHKDPIMRMYVARNEKCPIDILKRLSKSKEINVIAFLSLNPSCSINILIRLSKNGNYNVLQNSNLKMKDLKKIYFYNKNDEDYIKEVIKHPNWNLGEFQ